MSLRKVAVLGLGVVTAGALAGAALVQLVRKKPGVRPGAVDTQAARAAIEETKAGIKAFRTYVIGRFGGKDDGSFTLDRNSWLWKVSDDDMPTALYRTGKAFGEQEVMKGDLGRRAGIREVSAMADPGGHWIVFYFTPEGARTVATYP